MLLLPHDDALPPRPGDAPRPPPSTELRLPLAIELRSRRATGLLLPPSGGPRLQLTAGLPPPRACGLSLQRSGALPVQLVPGHFRRRECAGFVLQSFAFVAQRPAGVHLPEPCSEPSPPGIAFLLRSAGAPDPLQLCAVIPVAAGAFLERHAFALQSQPAEILPLRAFGARLLQHGRPLDRRSDDEFLQ